MGRGLGWAGGWGWVLGGVCLGFLGLVWLGVSRGPPCHRVPLGVWGTVAGRRVWCVSGGVLLSRTLAGAVPSALGVLASGFGMGPGVAPPL